MDLIWPLGLGFGTINVTLAHDVCKYFGFQDQHGVQWPSNGWRNIVKKIYFFIFFLSLSALNY